MKGVTAVVLAAGKGTRIDAKRTNKVLMPLAGKPMLGYTIATLKKAGMTNIIVVVGFQSAGVVAYLGKGCTIVRQRRQLGTGDAVKRAVAVLPPDGSDVIVLNGDDSAFFTSRLIRGLVMRHRRSRAAVTFLTSKMTDPTGYGRVIRDDSGRVKTIREDELATESEKAVQEINTGTYCFSREFLETYIERLRRDPKKREVLLTDLISLAVEDGLRVRSFSIPQKRFVGVNTREELKRAEKRMRGRVKP